MTEEIIATSPPPTKPSICAICGASFSNKQKLSAHKRMVHPGAPPQGHAPRSKTDSDYGKKGEHVCPFCRKRFPSPQSLGSHKRHHHPGQSVRAMAKARNQAKKTKGKFLCPECGQRFQLAKLLGTHRRAHHGITGTSQTASRARQLRAEIVARKPKSPATPATCTICNRTFKNDFGLTIHQSTIHGREGQSSSAKWQRSMNNGSNLSQNNSHESKFHFDQKSVDLGHLLAQVQTLIAHYAAGDAELESVASGWVAGFLRPPTLRKQRRSLGEV